MTAQDWLIAIGIVAFNIGGFGVGFWLEIRVALLRRRLMRVGLPTEAAIERIKDTHVTVNNSPVVNVYLTVRPIDRSPFQARTRLAISRLSVGSLEPGMVVPVRYDPNHPSNVIIVE